MELSVLGMKSFHLQNGSFQIGNESNLFGNEIFGTIIFYYQNDWLHCQSETSRIVNEMFSFSKRILPFQKRSVSEFFFYQCTFICLYHILHDFQWIYVFTIPILLKFYTPFHFSVRIRIKIFLRAIINEQCFLEEKKSSEAITRLCYSASQ